MPDSENELALSQPEVDHFGLWLYSARKKYIRSEALLSPTPQLQLQRLAPFHKRRQPILDRNDAIWRPAPDA